MSDEESYYSDLTDLSDVDNLKGTASRSRQRKGRSDANGNGYRIRKALKVPRASTYTAQSLHDQIHSGDINLEPEYQRDVVWPETKQVGVIDSILRNFYIPPVIFAVNSFEDGSESRTCIDGKQRLTSIHRFMDGLIPHRDPFTNEKLWYKNIGPAGKGAKARKILPEKYRKLFANKQIVCVEYIDLSDADEREIFQRVQLGMALTPAEKLQVTSSSRASFIRSLQSTYFSPTSSPSLTQLDMDRTRGSDFRSLANAVFVIEKYNETGAKVKELKNAGTLPQLEKWLAASDAVSQTHQDDIHEIFKTFLALVNSKDPDANEAFKTRVAPIEFIFIALLLSVLIKEKGMGKNNLKEMVVRIRQMRDYVREAHVDIRANSKVGGTLMEFIRGVSNGNDWNGNGKGKGVKRKRNQEESEVEEGEYYAKKPSTAMPRKTMNSAWTSGTTSVLPRPPFVAVPTPSKTTMATTATPVPDRLAAIRAAKTQDTAGRTNAQDVTIHAPVVRVVGGLPSPRSSIDNTSVAMSTPTPEVGDRGHIGERQRDQFNSRGSYSDRGNDQEAWDWKDERRQADGGWGSWANS